jgi:hypothetical protein
LMCPNHASKTITRTPLSYGVNTGIPDFPDTDPSGSAPPLPTARSGCVCKACAKGDTAPRTMLPSRDNMANGVFFDYFSADPSVGLGMGMPFATIDRIEDPKDKTIMAGENVDTVSWAFDPPNAQAPTAGEMYPTTERQLGIIWAPNSKFAAGNPLPEMTPPLESLEINVDAGKGNGSSYAYARPSSSHPGGVNMAFVAGNVWFMKDTLSYFVYVKLMTSSDDKAATRGPQGVTVKLPAGFASHRLVDAEVNP